MMVTPQTKARRGRPAVQDKSFKTLGYRVSDPIAKARGLSPRLRLMADSGGSFLSDPG